MVNIEAILQSPTVSFLVKDALQSALKRDPVDAANDAEMLAAILASIADEQAAMAETNMVLAKAGRLGQGPR